MFGAKNKVNQDILQMDAVNSVHFSSVDSHDAFKADFILVYEEKKLDGTAILAQQLKSMNRNIFLQNLCNFGLEIKKVFVSNLNSFTYKQIYNKNLYIKLTKNHKVYVLIKTPFEILLNIAEKMNFKLPIEVEFFIYNFLNY